MCGFDAASSSKSSPDWSVGMRLDRSPDMISRLAWLTDSMRRTRVRVIMTPPINRGIDRCREFMKRVIAGQTERIGEPFW